MVHMMAMSAVVGQTTWKNLRKHVGVTAGSWITVRKGVPLSWLRQKHNNCLLNCRSNDLKNGTLDNRKVTTSAKYKDEYLKQRFAGKVAICTASTTGIAYATAQRLAREGAKVIVSSRRQENVDTAVKILRDQNLDVSGIVCNQAKNEDRQRLIEFTIKTYGGIDLLFASGGANPHVGNLLSITESQWDKIFDVNVKSTFLMIQECVPHMIKRGGGAVVTNSSVAGIHFTELAKATGAYCVSKSCTTALSQALAEPLGHHGIRINSVAPGSVRSKFLKGFEDTAPAELRDSVPRLLSTMLNRHGDPDECGAAVAFLLSDDASFITGESLVVSGGALKKGFDFSF